MRDTEWFHAMIKKPTVNFNTNKTDNGIKTTLLVTHPTNMPKANSAVRITGIGEDIFSSYTDLRTKYNQIFLP